MPVLPHLWLVTALLRADPTELPPPGVEGSSCAVQASSSSLGPEHAPIRIDAYLDPARPGTWTSWVELRRLVGEQQGSVRVRVHVVRDNDTPDPRFDRVRAWTVAAAEQGRLDAALRIVDREGPSRLHARLAHPSQREEVSGLVGADLVALERSLASGCAQARVDGATAALERKRDVAGGIIFRPPIFDVAGLTLFEDTVHLHKLRPALAEARQRLRGAPHPPPSPTAAEDKGRLDELALPRPHVGVTLGGVGLPHRFLLFVEDEGDPSLFLMLPAVLSYRMLHPGRLSVQLMARGDGAPTERLRGRLCAARVLGRELEYVRFLATEPSLRRTPSDAQDALLRELDARAKERPCTAPGEHPHH